MPYKSTVFQSGIFKDKGPTVNSLLTVVVFCTGGGGTICSMQVKALVALGANAAIIGRRKPEVEAQRVDSVDCRLWQRKSRRSDQVRDVWPFRRTYGI